MVSGTYTGVSRHLSPVPNCCGLIVQHRLPCVLSTTLLTWCSDQLSPYHPSDPYQRLLCMYIWRWTAFGHILCILTPAHQLMSVSDNTRNNWMSSAIDGNVPLVSVDCYSNRTPEKGAIAYVWDIVTTIDALWCNVSSIFCIYRSELRITISCPGVWSRSRVIVSN